MGNTHGGVLKNINSFINQCFVECANQVQTCFIASTPSPSPSGLSVLNMQCLTDPKTQQALKLRIDKVFDLSYPYLMQELLATNNNDADAIAQNIRSLGEVIGSNYLQQCAINILSPKSNMRNNWSSTLDQISICTQQTNDVVSQANNLKTSLGNRSYSNEFYMSLIVLMIVVSGIIFKAVTSGDRLLTSPWIYLCLFLIADAYLIAGFYFGWPPYQPHCVLPLHQSNAQNTNKTIFLPVSIVSVGCMLLFIGWIFWHFKHSSTSSSSSSSSSHSPPTITPASPS